MPQVQKGKDANAYFTVELAMVFPIVLLFIVVIAHWTFMLYGRTILSQDAYLLALRGAILSDEEPAEYANTHAAEQFGTQYLGNTRPSASTSIDRRKDMIRVLLTTKTYHRGTSYYGVRANGKWQTQLAWEASYLRPPKRIRLLTRLFDLGSKGLAMKKEDSEKSDAKKE